MKVEKQTGETIKKTNAIKKGPDVVPELSPAGAIIDESQETQKEKTITAAESKKKSEDKGLKKFHPETDHQLLTDTDPQENMQGPLSSIMQNIKEAGEANDDESKEEADKKKDDNT